MKLTNALFIMLFTVTAPVVVKAENLQKGDTVLVISPIGISACEATVSDITNNMVNVKLVLPPEGREDESENPIFAESQRKQDQLKYEIHCGSRDGWVARSEVEKVQNHDVLERGLFFKTKFHLGERVLMKVDNFFACSGTISRISNGFMRLVRDKDESEKNKIPGICEQLIDYEWINNSQIEEVLQ